MPEIIGRKDGSFSSKHSLGENYQRIKKYDDTYYVLADDVNQDDTDIEATPGLPEMGTAALTGATVVGIDYEEMMTVVHPTTTVLTILWEVTVHYDSTVPAEGGSSGGGGDPQDYRPRRRWFSVKEKCRVEKDRQTDEPIITPAGEPIIVEDDTVLIGLEIKRYEPYPVSPLLLFDNVGHVNSAPFYGAPAGCALCDEISTEEEVINADLWEHVTYTFLFKFKDDDIALADGWDVELALAGFLFLPEATSLEPTTKLDKSGNPIRVFLNEDGTYRRLKVSTTLTQEPLYKKWNVKWQANFTLLGLEY